MIILSFRSLKHQKWARRPDKRKFPVVARTFTYTTARPFFYYRTLYKTVDVVTRGNREHKLHFGQSKNNPTKRGKTTFEPSLFPKTQKNKAKWRIFYLDYIQKSYHASENLYNKIMHFIQNLALLTSYFQKKIVKKREILWKLQTFEIKYWKLCDNFKILQKNQHLVKVAKFFKIIFQQCTFINNIITL